MVGSEGEGVKKVGSAQGPIPQCRSNKDGGDGPRQDRSPIPPSPLSTPPIPTGGPAWWRFT
jgi:hypothetical protein